MAFAAIAVGLTGNKYLDGYYLGVKTPGEAVGCLRI
jgi:hypothetical protein